MGRTRWVVGNWKQWGLRPAAHALASKVAAGLEAPPAGLRVGVAPPYLALDTVHAALAGAKVVRFAQDAAAQEEGAFTGEVGPAMLAEAGVEGVIVGHSERRHLLGESDALVAAKLGCALRAGMWAILCVGEPLKVRTAGRHEAYVLAQLEAALAHVAPSETGRLVVAYEPVWAIGTGRTARPEDAAAMHAAIRARLVDLLGGEGGDRSILYGGSVKPDNAGILAAAPDVDGFLVGGASKDADAFLSIVRTVAHHTKAHP
ncbi:MAG: triose-phosphate isomerase [Deltaproteobacteria bacterium]|nr:MAG: triose-phosphate isomerase [Deltaproteobacteria bacterium]